MNEQLDLNMVLWGNEGQNFMLPVNSAALRKLDTPTVATTAFCSVSFNELSTVINAMRSHKPVECRIKPQFNDLTRGMAGGNALLLKVRGHLGHEIPEDLLVGPDRTGNHWLKVHIMQEQAIERNQRDLLGPITNAIGQINTLRNTTAQEAMQSGSIVSLQALMHEVGVNDKEMHRVIDAMRNPSYPLLSKWNLIGQVIHNAERERKDTKGIGVKLRTAHVEKLRQVYNRCVAGLAKSLSQLSDDRTVIEKHKGEVNLSEASVQGVLIAGTKTMEHYHKQNHHQKFPTTYVVNNDAVGKKVFEQFLKG